ncbi:MAG: penicillin-binding protein 2, partial [Patescibacteria group bacterium]|nr:penicillin-binding protein 2 [Patescibacteria group bacterium]
KNAPIFSLNVVPAKFDRKNSNETISAIEQFLSEDQKKELQDNLSQLPIYANESILLLKELNYDQAILIQTILSSNKGIDVELQDQRVYADSLAFSHVLGYVGKVSRDELAQHRDYLFNDLIGKSGLESYYESYLRGQYGQQRIDILPTGEEEISYNKPAINGDNLVLSIDGDLQKKLFESLAAHIRANGNRGGSAVALNPNTGEVLALVSYPSFNSTSLGKGISINEYNNIYQNSHKPLFFRTITGEYPSGSVIKPVVAIGALEEKIITPITTVLSTGGISLGGWFFPDWKAGGHGISNVTKALAESVNTFFYYVGGGYNNFKGLGVDGLDFWMKRFGLGNLTGIDVAGEKSGFVPTQRWKEEQRNEPWYPGDTYHLSIGQGDLLVTPLQVANYTAAIANDGTLYKPYLLKEIIDDGNKTILKISPKILANRLASHENLSVVRDGMRAAVTEGSARSLSTLPIEVAAKTGTAQNEAGAPHAWFTCFAPYQNPQIVITVLVENGVEGGTAAAPVAKDVLNWWAENRNK